MKTLTHFLTLWLLLGSATAQTLVNREWVAQYGLPDTVAWSASTADGNGNLYTTGNTFVPGNGADVLLTKYDPEGNLLWQQTYDHQGQNDYGVAILHHANGELTVAAALHDATDSFDVGLLRYDGSGNLLWSYSYDYEGQYDVPTALAEDAQGNLYVCAASLGSSTDLDYLTLKVKEDGTFEWMQSYDFASGRDVPVSLVVDGNAITVTGASEDSSGQWDFYTVMYDDNGTVMEEYRLDKPGIGFDEPAGIARDAAGNFYLTGRASDNGSTYYIQTVKLDAQLNLVWEVSYTHSGQDGATGLGIDSQGNVYVCGYLAEPTGQDLILLKYNPNGNLLWDRSETSVGGGPAAATHLHINQEDQIFVTGYQAVNSQQRLYVAAFSSDGEKLWERSVEDGDYVGGEILTQGADAYVSAKSFSNGNYQYVAVKYSFYEREANWIFDANGDPLYAAHELIVRFDEDAVNHAAVDNTIGSKRAEFGSLGYYLTPSAAQAVQDQLAPLCGTASLMESSTGCPVTLLKVFRQLRTSDTTTISRLGETIPIPAFWATFVLRFPEGMDVAVAADSLQALFPLVKYAHPNVAVELLSAPNDSLYGQQASLSPTVTYPDGDINIEPAWQIETGKPFIKVGVFDTGIDWTHEDFGYNGTSLSSSKVRGWDFFTSSSILGDTMYAKYLNDHGTEVAGIIGAIRNNDFGVAGVAGGDDTGLPSMADKGVSLYSLQILEPFAFVSTNLDYIADAIITSSIEDPSKDYGYGLHITNHSWRFDDRFVEGNQNVFTDDNIQVLTDAVHFTNRAKVTFVAARGNEGLEDNGPSNPAYPAIIDDDWVLCVGGTGLDGGYKTINNGDNWWAPSTGPEIDVAAPSTIELVWTTNLQSDMVYDDFNGTSAAAPHVAGVAALLMSYLNTASPSYNNLAPEDVEQILEMTATDTDFAGYDTLTGYGRINAGAALELVKKPFRSLIHYGTDATFPFSRSISLHSTNQTIELQERYENAAGNWFLPGQYKVDAYRVEAVVNHNLTATDSIVAAWPRPSSSTVLPLYDGNMHLLARERVKLTNVTQSQATLEGFVYKVSNLAGTPLGWWPFDTTALTNANLTYTLLLYNTLATSNEPSLDFEEATVEIAPNPTNDDQLISISLPFSSQVKVELYDLSGRLIRLIEDKHFPVGVHQIKSNVSDLSPGMYLYQVHTDGRLAHIRMIKH